MMSVLLAFVVGRWLSTRWTPADTVAAAIYAWRCPP